MNKYILALTLAVSSVTASAATIDNFNGGAMHVSVDNRPAIGQQAASASVNYASAFGGGRTVSIEATGSLGASADVVESLGIYSHSADSFTSAASTISWASNVGVDLTDSSSSHMFALDIFSLDQGSVDLILSIADIDGNSDSFTLFDITVAGIQAIAFSQFTGVSLNKIDSISLEIVGGQSVDLVIDSFNTVPAPSALVLLGIGLTAFGFNSRKAKA